jgi:hypothetical protein
MPGDVVAVILLPELPPDVVACVVGVEELLLLPFPPHAANVKLTMKTKRVAIKRDFECCKRVLCVSVLEDIQGEVPLVIGNIGL